MEHGQVLIISFWNPTDEQPQQGIFIQEQASAVCRIRENVVFMQVNVLRSDDLFLNKTVTESDFFLGRLITVNLRTRLWKFWYVNPWALARVIRKVIREREDWLHPSLIHANVIHPCGIVGYLLSGKTGARMLISEHWSKAASFLNHPVYRRIALKAYRKCSAVVCVSAFLAEKITVATGHKKVITIPNIIDTGLFSFRPKQMAGDNELKMLCIATWRLPKRLDLIFESLCSYAGEIPGSIELTVIGNGIQADNLKMKPVPKNLHIVWAGYLSRSRIAVLMQNAHLFLHASDTETFSLVTAEALATGTPVLASARGALPELINDKNGILVENTPEAWVKGLREFSAKNFDNESIAAQNRNKYSADKIGRSIISLYAEIMT